VSSSTAQDKNALVAQASNTPIAGTPNWSEFVLRILPFLICALPSLLLLAFVPPTFNMRDSATLLTAPISFLVPHWPPLYPEFLLFNTSFFGVSEKGLYAIVIWQQILATAACIYICTVFKDNARRIVMSLLCAPANYFFVLSHGIYTEALSTAYFLFFIGAFARLALYSPVDLAASLLSIKVERPSDPPQSRSFNLSRQAVIYFVLYSALVLMTLTRHNMILFAVALPAFFALKALRPAVKTAAPSMVSRLKPLLFSLLLGACAFANVELFTEVTCRLLGSDSTAKFGRPAVNRMHELPWSKIPADEMTHLLGNMQKHCSDDATKAALSIMILDNHPWKGSYDQISGLLPSLHTSKSADQLMNDAAKAFFLTPNKYLYAEIYKSFLKYMGKDTYAFASFISANATSLTMYRQEADTSPLIQKVPLIQNIDPHVYDRIGYVVNPRLFDNICQYLPMGLAALALCAVGVAFGGASLESFFFAIALCASVVVYALLSAFITVVINRYLAPVNAVAWLLLGFSVLSWRKLPFSKSEKTAKADGN